MADWMESAKARMVQPSIVKKSAPLAKREALIKTDATLRKHKASLLDRSTLKLYGAK